MMASHNIAALASGEATGATPARSRTTRNEFQATLQPYCLGDTK